jgi:hypothetical protein
VTALVAMLLATGCGEVECATFPSAQAAFEKVLADKPRVLAIGEYHEVEGGKKAKSALKRFTESMLPSLKGRAASLLAETWITTGNCGEAEKKAVAQVQKTTQRPKTTEDELATMLGRSFDLGLKNHILSIDCDEYRSMVGADGELDGEKSLSLMRRKVEEKANELIEKGEEPLVLYGGAVHNDLFPSETWAPYSFGPTLSKKVKGYAELDLLVPEYVEKDEDLAREAWFAPAMKLACAGKTVLVKPHPGTFLLLFPCSRR